MGKCQKTLIYSQLRAAPTGRNRRCLSKGRSAGPRWQGRRTPMQDTPRAAQAGAGKVVGPFGWGPAGGDQQVVQRLRFGSRLGASGLIPR
jgi:hypothetical protein